MKQRNKAKESVERRGFLGLKRAVVKPRTVGAGGGIHREREQEPKHRPYSIEEMMFYDDLFNKDG